MTGQKNTHVEFDHTVVYHEFIQPSVWISEHWPSIIDSRAAFSLNGMQTTPVHREHWQQEPLLTKIAETWPIRGCGIFSLPAWRNYRWHCDRVRGVSINMLLNSVSSLCAFGRVLDEENIEFCRLDYRLTRFYLFNTQAMHTVFNFDQARYMFSVQFDLDKHELSYSDLRQWCVCQGLLET